MGHPAIAWRLAARAAASLVVAAWAAACGADATGGAAGGGERPDGGPFACEGDLETGTEAFDLRLGVAAGGEFRELLDGDVVIVVEGGQRLYMIEPDLRAAFAMEAETVCLRCVFEVGPAGAFGGLRTRPGVVEFESGDNGGFEAEPQVILGGKNQALQIDGAEVEVSARCDGHGLTGAVRRRLRVAVAWPDTSCWLNSGSAGLLD